MKKACFSVWFCRLAAVVAAGLSIARAQVEGPNGHYYKVVLEPNLLWDEAKQHAQDSTYNGVHGYLATITSAEEDQFIENLRQQAAPGGYGSLWVGGSQVGTGTLPTDGWYWVNGEGPIPTSAGGDGYSNWQQGEPKDSAGLQSEGHLSVGHFNTFGWSDEPDDRHIYGYVVEYPSRGTTATVKVTTIDSIATEQAEAGGAGGTTIDSAVFLFSRTGDLSMDLPVFFSVHGTAINGADYNEIAKSIIIPAGKSEVRLEIVPKVDLLTVVEPMETVGIRVEPSQILTPTAAYYIDQNQREAAAVIYESKPPDVTTAEVAIPRSGFTYKAGEPVVFLAALYSSLSVTTMNFYIDGVYVGAAVDNEHLTGLRILKFTWPNPTPGTHTLMAHAVATSRESMTILFSVEGTPEPTQVGIRFVEPATTEPYPSADFAPGYLEVRRSGSTAQNLQVFYSVGGTATADVDYEALQGYVVIPAGKETAKISVVAKDDTIDEPNETVVVTLTPPPIQPANATPLYTIDDSHSWAQVIIIDNDALAATVSVGITAVDSQIYEGAINVGGRFRIARSGPTNNPLTVEMQYGGTATAGTDYRALPTSITIPAGSFEAFLNVLPFSDKATEADETVIARFAPIPGANYAINPEHQSATMIIKDSTMNVAPIVKISKPSDGATFLEKETIHAVAAAVDTDGTVVKIEFLLDETVIAGKEGATLEKDFVAMGGTHTLTARATDNAGAIGISAPVHILVRHPDTVAFVHRELPAGYSPGVAFLVTLRADPPEGTFAYAVEDRPPADWRVMEVSSDGAFDSATGKVKYGPFTDDAARVLTYRVMALMTANGRYEFVGNGSVNGALYPINGDSVVVLAQQYHPADSNSDFKIPLAEVTAYTAAWKAGNSWPTGPVPIPVSYVTRARFIWQHGEAYRFDPSAGAPPASWIPENSGPGTLAAAAIGGAQRSWTGLRSGAATQVQINAMPPGGSSGYAVEEKPPRGWAVSNISHEGVFDAETGTIRWGVFTDTTARVLSYTVTPPATVTSIGVFSGQLSYDGDLVEVTAESGYANSVTSDGVAQIRINGCTATANGTTLNISGPAGQTAVIEGSTDFTNWTEVKSIFIPNGSVNCTDDGAASGRKFYRLRAQ